jgi:hypothetical protein
VACVSVPQIVKSMERQMASKARLSGYVEWRG